MSPTIRFYTISVLLSGRHNFGHERDWKTISGSTGQRLAALPVIWAGGNANEHATADLKTHP